MYHMKNHPIFKQLEKLPLRVSLSICFNFISEYALAEEIEDFLNKMKKKYPQIQKKFKDEIIP